MANVANYSQYDQATETGTIVLPENQPTGARLARATDTNLGSAQGLNLGYGQIYPQPQ